MNLGFEESEVVVNRKVALAGGLGSNNSTSETKSNGLLLCFCALVRLS